MALIRKYQLEETAGTLLIKKAPMVVTHRRETARPPEGPDDVPRARSEAEKIIEQALARAEQIAGESRSDGLREGKAQAGERIEEALATLNQAVKERKQIIRDAESEILRLSLRIAEQIIRSEVSLNRDVCLNIVSEALSRVSDREQIMIKANREDAEHLKRYKDRLAGMLDGVKSFSIIEDANIEPGGCIIETNLGFIDARISTKLKSIEDALDKVLDREEAA